MKFERAMGRIAELNISEVLSGVIRRETEICKDADNGREYDRTTTVSREVAFTNMHRRAILTKVLPGDVSLNVTVGNTPLDCPRDIYVSGTFSVTIPRKSVRSLFADGRDYHLIPGTVSAAVDELISEWLEQ